MPLAVPWALVTIGTTPWPRTVAVDLPKHLESPMAAPNRHNRAVVSLCDQRGRGSSRAAATKRAATSSKVSRLEPARLNSCWKEVLVQQCLNSCWKEVLVQANSSWKEVLRRVC